MCLYVYPLLLIGNGAAKIPLSLLGSGSVKTLPRQRIHTQQQKNFERAVFYAIRVVSRKVG
jgi:hypothetical protein